MPPCRVFSKDQRVSHTAGVENKRLGHALAIVKAHQDFRLATELMTNSEKTGYKNRGNAYSQPPEFRRPLAGGNDRWQLACTTASDVETAKTWLVSG